MGLDPTNDLNQNLSGWIAKADIGNGSVHNAAEAFRKATADEVNAALGNLSPEQLGTFAQELKLKHGTTPLGLFGHTGGLDPNETQDLLITLGRKANDQQRERLANVLNDQDRATLEGAAQSR